MIIIAYSTRHRGYTAFSLPHLVADVAMPFTQLTGYHATAPQARLAASGFQGTVTGRFSSSRPEFQDPIHEGFTRRPIVSADFSVIEERALAHYGMTAREDQRKRPAGRRSHPLADDRTAHRQKPAQRRPK